MERTDHTLTDQIATRWNDAAILVSLELSVSSWLVTALLPGSEKMSKHSLPAGKTRLHVMPRLLIISKYCVWCLVGAFAFALSNV